MVSRSGPILLQRQALRAGPFLLDQTYGECLVRRLLGVEKMMSFGTVQFALRNVIA